MTQQQKSASFSGAGAAGDRPAEEAQHTQHAADGKAGDGAARPVGSGAAETPHGVPDMPETPPRRRFPTVGDLFAMLGIVFGLQIVAGVVLALYMAFAGLDAETMDPADRGWLLALTYVGSMLPATLLVFWYRRMRGGRGRVCRFSKRGFEPMLLLWAFVLMLAVSVVCEPLFALLPDPPVQQLGSGLWTLLSVAVAAPLLEETICRGVVLGSLRERYGVVAAWVLSSAFFGVLHVQPLLVVNAFVLGLIFGFVYLATDSLWSVIILHALNNLVSYLLMAVGLERTMLIDVVPSRFVYGAIYIGALAVTLLSGAMIRRALAKMSEAEKISIDA